MSFIQMIISTVDVGSQNMEISVQNHVFKEWDGIHVFKYSNVMFRPFFAVFTISHKILKHIIFSNYSNYKQKP